MLPSGSMALKSALETSHSSKFPSLLSSICAHASRLRAEMLSPRSPRRNQKVSQDICNIDPQTNTGLTKDAEVKPPLSRQRKRKLLCVPVAASLALAQNPSHRNSLTSRLRPSLSLSPSPQFCRHQTCLIAQVLMRNSSR